MNGEHEDIREQFSAYLDGEMDTGARAAFEARIAADPALRVELDAWRRVDALYRELEPVRAPEALEAAVLDEMRGVRIRFRRPRAAPVRLWPVLAAAACFLVVMGLMFSRTSYVSTRTQLAREQAAPPSPMPEAATEAAADAARAQRIPGAQPEAKMETAAGAPQPSRGDGMITAPEVSGRPHVPEGTYFVMLDTAPEAAPEVSYTPAPEPPVPEPSADMPPARLAPSPAMEIPMQAPPPVAAPRAAPQPPVRLDGITEKQETGDIRFDARIGAAARDLGGLEPAPAPAPAQPPVAAVSAPAPIEQEVPPPVLAETPPAQAETVVAVPEPLPAPQSVPSLGEDRLERHRRAPTVGGYGGGYGGYGGTMRGDHATEAQPPKAAPPAAQLGAAPAPLQDSPQAVEAGATREANGHVFTLCGDTWQQEDYADESLTELRRDTRFYRVLLKNHPEIAAVAGLGPRVIFNVGGHWYLLLPAPAL